MEKNEKKKISCSYALLVVVLFATVCFLVDYIVIDRKLNENKGICYNNSNVGENVNNIENVDNDKTDVNKDSSNNQNDKLSIDKEVLDNVINNSDIVIEDKDYDGNITKTYVAIVDGNIILKKNDKVAKILSDNAKSVYYVTHHQGWNHILFYITTDNKLYQVSYDIHSILDKNISGDKAITPTPKLLADNAIEFVALENGFDGNNFYASNTKGATEHINMFIYSYIKILTTDNNINNIYFDVDYYYGGSTISYIEK